MPKPGKVNWAFSSQSSPSTPKRSSYLKQKRVLNKSSTVTPPMAAFSPQAPPTSTNASASCPSRLLEPLERGRWRSISWSVFQNGDHGTYVCVCVSDATPPWQRQMEWEPPHLPEEAVYGRSSGENGRSLKFSFQVIAINLSRARPNRGGAGAGLSGKTSELRRAGDKTPARKKPGKVKSSVTGHANKCPLLSINVVDMELF